VAGPFTGRRSANLGPPLFFLSLGANQCGRNVLDARPQLTLQIHQGDSQMKIAKIFGGFVSLGLLAGLAVPFASAKPQAAPAAQAHEKGMGMHDKLQAALDSLNLTDDQKAKVKDVLADAKTKHQAVKTDASLNEDQKRAKMKELHDGLLAKLNEVLTPDQQTELKSKMAEAKAKPPAKP
jgi:Spy/CpxP family protein refolding chaperone